MEMSKAFWYGIPGRKQLIFCCQIGEQNWNGETDANPWGLQNKSVSSLLLTILTLTSKKLTEDLDFSSVNYKLGWALLRQFRNLSSLTFCADEKYVIYIS